MNNLKLENTLIKTTNNLIFFFNNLIVDKMVSNLLVSGRGGYIKNNLYSVIKSFKLLRIEGYSLLTYTLHRLKQKYSLYVDAVKTKRTPYRIIRIRQYVISLNKLQESQIGFSNFRTGTAMRKERLFFNRLKNELFDSFKGSITHAKIIKKLQTEMV